MYRIGRRFTFDAAHHLDGLPDGHKCSRQHGHTYTIEVEVTAADLAPPGFVTDFADLAPLGAYIDAHLDHRDLSEILAVQPTSENLARHLYDWCAANMQTTVRGTIAAIRVHETPVIWAEYRPELP